ncbi:hypothetical protein J2754_003266 [Halarchaeum solikamskense]|uniref:S8 family serine peptidase n=1 Tax=Halarchaeum nitratireducens TaxID=489913 RepID=UPI001B3A86DA|nr:S8 family serine peptidase [Halarchaeum solikamskense]MBP2252904.1 hypothetical protein [Halarchaeum solikamskense]
MLTRTLPVLLLCVVLLATPAAASGPAPAPTATDAISVTHDWSSDTPVNVSQENESSTTGNRTNPVVNASVTTQWGTLPLTAETSSGDRPFTAQSHTTSLFVATVTDTTPARLDTINDTGARVRYVVDTQVELRATDSQADAVRALSFVTDVHRPLLSSADASFVPQVGSMNADALRRRGIDGSGVSIGVLSNGGIDTTDPVLSGHIAGVRSFSGGIDNGGDDVHGTAVSELVVDSAPGASLYVTNFGTSVSYRRAVQWLRHQHVDVIVMSVSFFEQPLDGTGPVSQTADRAVSDGIVWVNSAGNYAQAHWQGPPRDPDGDAFVNVDGPYEVNALANGTTVRAGHEFSLSLTWNDWPTATSDYDLYLVRKTDSGLATVASSRRTQDGARQPTESITARAPTDGVYGVVIVKQDDATPAVRTLELFSKSDSPLQYPVARGSLTAPAVGNHVLAAGAYSLRSGDEEPYSSHGPTNDGRIGLDVLAPDGVATSVKNPFYGTSAAAPNTAGVVALLLGVDPTLSPAEVTELLHTSAMDVGDPGPDVASGYGKLDAGRAVRTLETPVADQYDFDARLESGRTAWTGQSLYVRDFLASGRTDVLHRVADGSVGAAVRSVPVNDDDGVAVLNTTGLTGRYVLTGSDGTPLAVANGSVTDTTTVADAAFTLRSQSLSLSTSASDGTRTLAVASNRSGYDLVLAWDAARFETADASASTDLAAALAPSPANATAVDTDGDGTADALALSDVGTTVTLRLDQRALANATYGVAARAVDTEANASAVFDVGTPTGTIAVSPATTRVTPNATTTVDLVPQGFPTTVASYSLTLQTTDPNVVAIRGFDLPTGTTGTVTRTDTDSIAISATAMNSSHDGDFGTATIAAGTTGTASLRVSNATATTPAGTQYTLDTNSGRFVVTTQTVPAIVGDTPPRDPDGDGVYEDVNGDGTVNVVDVQALFSNQAAAAGHPAFDINGDGDVNVVDVQSLFVSIR